MLDVLGNWQDMVAWVGGHVVYPALSWLHLDGMAGDPKEVAEALTIAALQVGIIALVFRPLESLLPAERWNDRRLTRVDLQYTLLMVLGIMPLFGYLVLTPLSNLVGIGSGSTTAEDPASGLKLWVPWFQSHPLLLFAVYYVLYDLTYYWMHRTQHVIPWWWALHSMHHSQRQLSCWSNDRGSYLDAALQSVVLGAVGLVLGVSPSEFALLVMLGELVQNFSHANVRVGFGRAFERVFVGPRFHRLHHMRVDPDRPGLHNCNFGQVLPVWDIVFGTALYGEGPRPTGVADPVVDADNDRGLVAQQWGTLRRFWGAFRRRAGWRLGEVAFGQNYEPIAIRPGEHGHAEARLPADQALATLRAACPAAKR